MEREYFSIKEVAQKLHVHYNTIVKLIKTRKITAVKVAGAWRISGVAIDSYLDRYTINKSSKRLPACESDMDIEELEIEILAIRKIADKVLALISASKKSAPAKCRVEKIDGVAGLTARLLTGRMKPDKLKKKK